MSKTTTCPIRILNKTYEMKCHETEVGTLQAAVEKLNAVLAQHQQTFPEFTSTRLMLMASITLAHELMICQKQQAFEREKIAKVIRLLEKNTLLLQTMQDRPLAIQMAEA